MLPTNSALRSNSAVSVETADVIIIGAGISGLNAAKWLTESGVHVIVLEARNRVGGRTYTADLGKFGWVDLGGSYVTPKQTHIMKLIDELGIETFPVYDDQKSVHISQGRRNVYETQWPTFDWCRDATSAKEVQDVINLMDELKEQIPRDDPWDCVQANQWDNITLKEFFDQNCSTSDAHEFLSAFCQSNVSASPAQVSLLWYLWYIKMIGGNEVIWNVKDGGQEMKLCGGTMQICERIARLLGDKIKLNEAVYSMDQQGGKVTVKTLHGKTYYGRYAILAIPLPLLHKIHYNPPLPPSKNQLIQRVAMGTTIKCEIYYDKPFWRNNGLSGFTTCGDGIDVVNNSIDDCKPDSKYGQLTCFVACEEALKMQDLTNEGRCMMVARCLAKAFDTEEALNPIHYIDQNWSSEQYTGGGYTVSYPTGVLSKYGRYMREPFGLIHFAGTETATEWSGYMNGAAQAGERAAKEILDELSIPYKNGVINPATDLRHGSDKQVHSHVAAENRQSLKVMKPSEPQHRL